MVYRIGPDWSADLMEVEERLAAGRFLPCGATQPQSSGWVEPRGVAHGALAESVGGQWLLKLMVEQRLLPGPVVRRRTEELVQQIEQTTGRKPGRKQVKEIREQAVLELLPMAFTKQAAVPVWIDPQARLLLVDAASSARAEEAVSALVKALDGFAVSQLQTATAPATAMAEWLSSGEPPAGFTVDRECELKSACEMKSVVRYARHPLDTEEVRQHIALGKLPTRLALTWEGRVSFALTDTLQLKKLAFLDGVFEGVQRGEGEESFDADMAIATGELGRLLPDLIEALGGEQAAPGAPGLPAQAAPSTAPDDGSPPW